MFIPEFVDDSSNTIHLVANHSLETKNALALSIEFNRARIQHGRNHIPGESMQFVLHYDVRGQSVDESVTAALVAALADLCVVRVRLE